MLAAVVIAVIFLFSGFDSLRKGVPIKNSTRSGREGSTVTTTLKNSNGYLNQFISEGNTLENKPTSSKSSNTRARESNSFMPPNFIGPSGPPSVVGPSGPPPGY